MKTSLKLVISILFAVSLSQNTLAGMCGPQGCRNHEQQAPLIVSNVLLKNNSQVASYLPKDLQGEPGTSTSCDENGTLIQSGKKDGKFVHGRCYNYKSTGTGASWRIRFSNYAANNSVSTNDIVATEVFKMTREGATLWVSFTGHRALANASPEARKFAGEKASNNSEVARKQDENSPAGDIIKDAQKGDTEELVKKGIGIMKGFKF